MEKKQQQQKAEHEEKQEGNLEGLHMESSPYVNYGDLEDYKRKGYGTQGHLQPEPARGAGATDAPTSSGASLLDQPRVPATDTINEEKRKKGGSVGIFLNIGNRYKLEEL
ncbi:LEA_6 domain-containing protein [Cephalotus follicularis]|uniref:LEA_6 domain-containing protein n=1 Tax=Cephalotus follicularis TaxID=3775 RepID=A0A1Q3ASY0_CEPFO|nr:LEA_6 domain-containing protein [Cephalotus follicularis]